MIAVLAGNPSVDKLYTVEVLQQGEIHRPEAVVSLAGGKGLNVARVVNLLGGDSHVLGVLAGHAGRWIADALAEEGVRGTFVWSTGETRLSLSVAQSTRREEPLTEFYEPAAPIAPGLWSELEGRVAEVATDASLLCLSGSVIPGAPVDGYRRVLEVAHDAGCPVALDSHGAAFAAALDGRPELVKVNAVEAAEALGVQAPERDLPSWATEAAAELRDRAGGQGVCVVTCGREGVAMVDASGARYRAVVDASGPYPVGAGDAVLAALAVAHANGEEWPDALRAAVGAGAANAELPGSGVLDPLRARALGRRAAVERVLT